MQVIPVLDLAGGRAVHAKGGHRAEYLAVDSILAPGRPGDARMLARAYGQTLRARACYVADLDAIAGGSMQKRGLGDLAFELVARRMEMLVDAGVREPAAARAVLAAGATSVVVGLETLHSFNDLAAIVTDLGAARVVFSLDLREGDPTLRPEMRHRHGDGVTAPVATQLAAAAGVTRMLVLDLARVGMGMGIDLLLLASLRAMHPATELLAGGGIGGVEDLRKLAETGADAVLIASALHDGRLTADDLREAERLGPARSGHSRDSL